MRRTTPPVAGALLGADCPVGPKRAGSGGRPRRAGGRGGGDGDPSSPPLNTGDVGGVRNLSPSEDVELGETGRGGGRALSCSAVFNLRLLLVSISKFY